MSKNWQDITLALAGIFQATGLVAQVAKTGQVTPEPYQTSIDSILQINPDSTLAVYGGSPDNLSFGLEIIRDLLQPGSQKHREALRYGLGVLHLQKKLDGRPDMLRVMASRLNQVAQQAEHFSSTHENVISNMGNLYSETLSTFRFRIQVNGDYNYLQQQRIANQIRALLLAAVRSAMLWRQVGGNRWQLLFNRKDLTKQIDQWLRTK